MKAGRSNLLSGDSSTIHDATRGHLVFVVPEESIIRKKLAYSEGAECLQLKQYRIVLKD